MACTTNPSPCSHRKRLLLAFVVASLPTTPVGVYYGPSTHFGAPDQRAQLSAGREPFRGQITLFGRMACGRDFARGTTVHCGGSRHQALSGFFGLVVGLVRWWRRAGSVLIVIVEAMDAEGLLEAGQHEALQPLGGVVQEAGLDQRFGELVERVHLIFVRQGHHHPLQHLQHALCPSCRFRTGAPHSDLFLFLFYLPKKRRDEFENEASVLP
jgi:hypothetical protein